MAGGERLGNKRQDAGSLASQHLLTGVIAPICHHGDFLASGGLAGLAAHGGQLCSVAADVGHLVCDDQMMLGVDSDLNIVADDAGALTTGRHRPGVGRSEEHTSELQSLMRISYAVFCLKKKNNSSRT